VLSVLIPHPFQIDSLSILPIQISENHQSWSRFRHLQLSFKFLVTRASSSIAKLSDRKFGSRVRFFKFKMRSSDSFWSSLKSSVRVARSKKLCFLRLRIHLGGSNLEVKNKSPVRRRWELDHYQLVPWPHRTLSYLTISFSEWFPIRETNRCRPGCLLRSN
jgi:hypothetical protein